MKLVSIGLNIYATDYDGLLPAAKNWGIVVEPYVRNSYVFDDPTAGKKSRFGYAFYRPLGGVNEDTVANQDQVPLLIQTEDFRRNANSDLSGLPVVPRVDGKKDIVSFLDTSTKTLDRSWAKTAPVMKFVRKKP